ncbi:MAG TPA: hypothetical protein VKZ59_03655 [Acidobacteriota bacterium]|nr:hypothetical protein [Acidobacteriota bacterium]
MTEKINFVRLPWLLLFLFFLGKLIVGAAGGSYELSNRLFAMVPLTIHLCIVWGALTKAQKRQGIGSAAVTGFLIAVFAQTLILVGTVVPYTVGIETPFTNPVAIVGQSRPLTMGEILGGRIGGLVVNSIIGMLAATIGWLLGSLIPSPRHV